MEKTEIKIEKLRSYWDALMNIAGFKNVEMNERVFTELITIYSGIDRSYYNLDYLLERVEFYNSKENNDPGVMFAVWFSRYKFSQVVGLKGSILSSSNCARSAARRLGAKPMLITFIENVIYKSVNHISLVKGLKMMDDLSLYSLTKNPDDFMSDFLKIRKQYCAMDDHIFKDNVRNFVKKIREEKSVFKTDYFKSFETQAKENLKMLASY